MCLKVERILAEKNETSDKVLEKIIGILKEAGVEILDTIIDWSHSIGEPSVGKATKTHVRALLFGFLL